MQLSNRVGEVAQKHLASKMLAFVLGKRFCLKHAGKEFSKNTRVTMSVGICDKCKKVGLVFYATNGND